MLAEELLLIKGYLREEGLSTKGILLQEFREVNIDKQKKWHEIKERAKKRTAQLADTFPFAFGVHQQERFKQEFLQNFFTSRV